MSKSISNLYRYVEISKFITKKYIEALSEVNVNKVPIPDIEKLSSSITVNNRKDTGFNIIEKDTLKLFLLFLKRNIFANKSIRNQYFEVDITSISKLKAHRRIKKIARKNKYYLTTKDRKITNSILFYTRKTLLN